MPRRMSLAVCLVVLLSGAFAPAAEPPVEAPKPGDLPSPWLNNFFGGPNSAIPAVDCAKPTPADLASITVPELDPVTEELVRRDDALRQAVRRMAITDIDLTFEKVPLREVIVRLFDKAGIKVRFNENELKGSGLGVDLSEPVTATFKDMTLDEAIEEVLEPRGLDYYRDRGRVRITTRVIAEEALQARFYLVGDLTWTIRDDGEAFHEPRRLIDVIGQTTSGPWFDVDGIGGTICSYDAGGMHALFVRQTEQVHEEIEELLHRMRLLRGEMKLPKPDDKT